VSGPRDRDIGERLRFAHGLLDETDAIAVEAFRGEIRSQAKPDRTLVTRTDTEIERRVRERVAEAFAADGILGEELGNDAADAEARWIVDPIDATHNFVRRIGIFATLLAFERAGELELGLVSAPVMGQRWFAARGQGAFVRSAGEERRIHVSSIRTWSQAQLITSSIGRLDAAGEAGLRALALAAWRNRGFGDFWGHMLVAAGSAEAMVEDGLKPWDLAAPAIIVTEAGGRVTDFAGRSTRLGPEAVSTNGLVHDEVLAGLNP